MILSNTGILLLVFTVLQQCYCFAGPLFNNEINSFITFDKYYSYSEMVSYMEFLAKSYPEIATFDYFGSTSEGRILRLLKLSSNTSNRAKDAVRPSILVDGGVHAREWIGPATVLYIMQQLVENPENRDLLRDVDWYLIPVLNADGYEYTRISNETRSWRKTRKPNPNNPNCPGVDLNRNFPFHWMETGASQDPCSDVYAGTLPFTESEAQSFATLALALKPALKLYLSFHSYGWAIIYPWGYTAEPVENAGEHQLLGEAMAGAIEAYNGTRYKVSSVGSNAMFRSAGGSDDWMKGSVGVDLVYTLELPGGPNGHELPPEKILGAAAEVFQGVRLAAEYVDQKYNSIH